MLLIKRALEEELSGQLSRIKSGAIACAKSFISSSEASVASRMTPQDASPRSCPSRSSKSGSDRLIVVRMASSPSARHSCSIPCASAAKKGVSVTTRPLLLYCTKRTASSFALEKYPSRFAAAKICAAVSGFTPFFRFRALDTVAVQKPVASLISRKPGFIHQSPFACALTQHIHTASS